MLKKFGYSLDAKVNLEEDSLVVQNNKLINENKTFFDNLAKKLSNHIEKISIAQKTATPFRSELRNGDSEGS